MLYVFVTCLTSQECCGDLQGTVVLKTEDMDIAKVLQKLKYDVNGSVIYRCQQWNRFTDEERKVVDEIFSYHPTLKDSDMYESSGIFKYSKKDQGGDKHRPISFNAGDIGLLLTIDDFNE